MMRLRILMPTIVNGRRYAADDIFEAGDVRLIDGLLDNGIAEPEDGPQEVEPAPRWVERWKVRR